MICVHYQADKTFEFYSRMNKIENTLFSEGFLRVHKSYLVNKDCIQNVKGTMIVLFDKTEIPVSRAMVATLRDMLAKNVN